MNVIPAVANEGFAAGEQEAALRMDWKMDARTVMSRASRQKP